MTLGLDFQKQLDSWEYKLSPAANEKLNECAKIATQTADDWINKFNNKGDIGAEEAKKLVAEATEDCSRADAEFLQAFGKELDDEFRRVFETFSKKYKEYIERVLKKRFPDDPSIQKLKKVVLCLPTVEAFIKERKYEHKYKVQDGWEWSPVWWNPLWWLRCKPTWKEVKEDRVDLSTQDAQQFLENLRATTLRNIDQFKQIAAQNSEKARQTFVKTLATVQSRLAELAAELKKARASKASKARSRRIAREKLEWYEQFKRKVEFILAV